MCFTQARIKRLTKWNWDGDQIIHQSIVPSSRPPVGYQSGGYDIDVREFLISERNAVIQRALGVDIKTYMKKMAGASWTLFTSRNTGSFDHRAHIITEYVSDRIKYLPTNGLDPWQFPDETLHLKSGDCEDRALLIASLLLASGISTFNIRVALGKFRAWLGKSHRDFDHVWVMYKNEAGRWEVIEPTRTKASDKKGRKGNNSLDRAEYIPHFLFNDSHLWQVHHTNAETKPRNPTLKRDWSSLRPEFAGWVHKSILNEALGDENVCPSWVLNALNRHFTSYLWQRSLTVDDVDNPGSYDPRDHFDNGYIDESWALNAKRLQQFKAASNVELDTFHIAAHGIADFYAHSSYGHFAIENQEQIAIFDPGNPQSKLRSLAYDSTQGFDLTLAKFTQNRTLWAGTPAEAAALWKNKLISGRYGQRSDSQGAIEAINFIPKELEQSASFKLRGSLPHHNEIAVDEDTASKAHVLYDTNVYSHQYQLRYNAAVRHIRKAFVDNWTPT